MCLNRKKKERKGIMSNAAVLDRETSSSWAGIKESFHRYVEAHPPKVYYVREPRAGGMHILGAVAVLLGPGGKYSRGISVLSDHDQCQRAKGRALAAGRAVQAALNEGGGEVFRPGRPGGAVRRFIKLFGGPGATQVRPAEFDVSLTAFEKKIFNKGA